jgi:hypothetical protein
MDELNEEGLPVHQHFCPICEEKINCYDVECDLPYRLICEECYSKMQEGSDFIPAED